MQEVQKKFSEIFSQDIKFSTQANGRINTIGEHTDYNHGLVLPALLSLSTNIYAAINSDIDSDTIQIYSTNFPDEIISLSIHSKPNNTWTDYVVGTLQQVLAFTQTSLPGLQIFIDSKIPQGSGVSSSAALEIALLRLANSILSPHKMWDAVEIAKLGQKAENDFVGMPCGLMDQMIVSVGKDNAILCIDFANPNTPQYQEYSQFPHAEFVVIPSQVPHRLVDGGYKTRRDQCEQAARILKIPHLSTLSISDLDEALSKLDDATQQKRVRHIVTENERVKRGAQSLLNQDTNQFGGLMFASHCSQRDDYDVSLPEIDELVDLAMQSGAIGARLCGGGFGGSIVALIEKSSAETFLDTLNTKHPSKTFELIR